MLNIYVIDMGIIETGRYRLVNKKSQKPPSQSTSALPNSPGSNRPNHNVEDSALVPRSGRQVSQYEEQPRPAPRTLLPQNVDRRSLAAPQTVRCNHPECQIQHEVNAQSLSQGTTLHVIIIEWEFTTPDHINITLRDGTVHIPPPDPITGSWKVEFDLPTLATCFHQFLIVA